MLEARNVGYTIGTKMLLDAFELSVQAGQFVALIGPNGAGKSTALRLLGGELRADRGTIHLDGDPLELISPLALARKRACFQQNPSVNYPFTVREIATLGRQPHRRGKFESPHDRSVVAEALRAAGVTHLQGRNQTTLSGGEATRAHLARVLAQEPRLLLLDEPTNHLDLRYQQEILRVCKEHNKKGCAIVAVLHDLNLASIFSDHVVLLDKGLTVAQGAPREVLTPVNIRSVYGMESVVWNHPGGCPWVVPLWDA